MKKLIILLLAGLLVLPAAYAQKSFDMRYNEAVEYYTTRQYDLAIKTLEAAKKSPGVTRDQQSKADMLIKQCRSAKSKLSDLNLSKENLTFPGNGRRDSIYVTAGKGWSVTAHPYWCHTSVDADILYITADPNEADEMRKGVVEVSMGKERTAYILVTQDKRQSVTHKVRIQSYPARSIVYIDQENGVLAENFFLGEGKHNIRIEKNGYDIKDTTIVVGAHATEEELDFKIPLTPSFAMIQVNINPEEGYVFDAMPTMDISGIPVNLHPSTLKSFNVDQNISHYELYEDNVIPLQPGQYVVRVESPGFKVVSENINIARGEKKVLDFSLPVIFGVISVQNAENAEGARVFIDGKDLGELPLNDVRIKAGNHVMRVEKQNFLSEKDEYQFSLNEGESRTLNISMKSYSIFNVTSNPSYCQVLVDGEQVATTPCKLILKEGEHLVRLEKKGFYPVEREVDTYLMAEVQDLDFELQKTYSVTISSDVEGMDIVVKKGNTVYVDQVQTPAPVELPLSKTPYHLKLTDRKYSTAYQGWFWFTNGKRENVRVLTYSKEGFQFVGGNFYLKRPAPYFKNTSFGKGYQRLADLSLVRLKLLPGLTTNAVKATAFWETNASEQIQYPGDVITDKNVKLIPALTVLFINGEFRMGGGLHNNVDLAMVATYSWYPNVSGFIPMTHMSGHDIFLGFELGSRIPIFNLNLKAGFQSFYGQANVIVPGTKSSASKSNFATEAYKVPFNKPEFVITVGFTLGGRDSKGNNVLKLF